MKIYYVKNNSERAKEFQLKTIIYEDNGAKYVKKQALTKEAIPHLMKMKETYKNFSKSIINPKISLVPIVQEASDSLTFEFIEGESLETRLNHASQINYEAVEKIIAEYMHLLQTSFRTTTWSSSEMITPLFKTIFSDLDYSNLSNLVSFKDNTNLDLIFSNIIYKDEQIYLIDYEWVYPISLPLDYIAYRPISMLSEDYATALLEKYNLNQFIYGKMERTFVDKYVMNGGFYMHKLNYTKQNLLITSHIDQLKEHIQSLQSDLKKVNDELFYARSIVDERDKQLNDMKLKNRVKRFIKKIIPSTLTKNSTISNSLGYDFVPPILTSKVETELSNFIQQPLISIIMPTYNVSSKWLNLAIESVEKQWYTNWELCIVDDCSTNDETLQYLKSLNNPKIHVEFLTQNLNISEASNSAIKNAKGTYISLLDNDDELTPDALYEMVRAINLYDADFIYSDEDFISTDGICTNPHFKPDFSPDLLLSHNYITHLTCFNKDLLDEAGLFNSKFDGSQDYDLFLRLTEKAKNIYHIPKVLYHWRTLDSSTSVNSDVKPEALSRGLKVIEETLQRRQINAKVIHTDIHHYFRTKYTILGKPLISIIIPFKDKPELLKMCISSIIEKSTYTNYEIIALSNNSEEKETFEMIEKLQRKDPRISFYEYNHEFNYASINNYAVNHYAKGEHVLLLNNDIEIITPDWIEAMLEHSQRKEVGCVGAKLYYPNDTIQHAGIIIGLGGYAGHSHKMLPKSDPGYFNRLRVVQNVSAVTAACLMIKKSIYTSINGMDDINFKIAYNDVDFCLRVREAGFLNIFTPFAELYHHESISRGYETTPEKIARFQTEKDALYLRHTQILKMGDPYYNPNLSHDKEDFSLCLN